ncbi:MAG TPA: hypothetical protein VFJ58_13350 [Armatimonadota bacterium]|nr:hypothetical protein [Armatimonadota bacterium]
MTAGAAKRLGCEVPKYHDLVEATTWLNNMVAQGLKLAISGTSNGELWLNVEGLIPSPEVPK